MLGHKDTTPWFVKSTDQKIIQMLFIIQALLVIQTLFVMWKNDQEISF